MRLRATRVKRAAHPALTAGGAVLVLATCLAAYASNPPAPPPDSQQTVKSPPAKESDSELVKKRMRLCRQRPELCVQQKNKNGAERERPHSPAPDEVGK